MKDKHRSDLVFEAYRRVCLSASRELGPRIIAIITAELMRADRMAEDLEEIMLMAAEKLRDLELRDFAVLYHEALGEYGTRMASMVNLPVEDTLEIEKSERILLYFKPMPRLPLLLIRLQNIGIVLPTDSVISGPTLGEAKPVILSKWIARFIVYIDRATGPGL